MTDRNTTKTLLLERDGPWLTVRFNQPAMRNALTEEMSTELRAVLGDAEQDRTLRGITFRGEGQTFCAGGDLKTFAKISRGELSKEEVANFSREGGELFRQLDEVPQLTIMVVEGAAMGGGFGLACCGDVVIAHQDARFSLTETRVGLFPAQILPFVVRRMGRSRARRAMLTASTLNGAQAVEQGLADFVASDGDGLASIEQGVRAQLLRCAPGAIAITKAMLHASRQDDSDTYRNRAADAFAECMLGDEAREGTIAFVQRRKPTWAE